MTDKERFKAIFETQVMRAGAEELLEWLESTDFFEAPASTRFHGTYPGGLVAHSLNVYDQLLFDHSALKYGGQTLAEAARAAKITGKEFDSLGEYEYYIGTVAPKVARGEIVEWEAHPCFPLFPAGQYGALKLRPVRYTADFRLVYADGTVEIVEIKSKFVRRMQRDYALRRRVFLEQVARPAGWKFTEIITADSKEEIDRWTELTKGAK